MAQLNYHELDNILKQLTKIHSTEEVIKKSTFISIVAPIVTIDEAKQFLLLHSRADVTHNCWAYKVGQVYRFNDDGEPSGTAGKPIYNAIEGQGFDNTVALVIRYYGGIKLGTGGLMRAYGGGVSRCLQAAEFAIIKPMIDIQLTVAFQYIQIIHNMTKNYEANIKSEKFTENGVNLEILLLESKKVGFIKEIINITKGTVVINTTDKD